MGRVPETAGPSEAQEQGRWGLPGQSARTDQWAERKGRPPANPSLGPPSAMGVEPPNFSWVIPGRLAGLALPRVPAHYQFLLEQGVRHLVSLTERGPPHGDSCPGLKLHRLRIADFCPPAPEQIDRFVQIVDEANARGEVSGRSNRKEGPGGSAGTLGAGGAGEQGRGHGPGGRLRVKLKRVTQGRAGP